MFTVKAEPITNENFAPFGKFYTMDKPEGYPLSGAIHKYFPDRLTASAWKNIGFSPILVKKPAEYVITQQEYHTTTW
ncbi:MAG: ureidoglycolate lyase, partial [bacterium]|nr:ureidoglycolate lyase [bacterium]